MRGFCYPFVCWIVTVSIVTVWVCDATADIVLEPGTTSNQTATFWTNGGNNATFASIGQDGYGSIEVNGGSQLLTGDAALAAGSGSQGIATVDGLNSRWENSNLFFVGFNGAGTAYVQNQATLSTATLYLGDGPSASGTLHINNATVDATIATFVGNSGTGSIHFSNGGVLNTGLLQASREDLSGVGTIHANSIASASGPGYGSFDFNGTTTASHTLASVDGDAIQVHLTPTNQHDLRLENLTVRNGANLSSDWLQVGTHVEDDATATIRGSGTTLASTVVLIGTEGQGQLVVSDAAGFTATSGSIGSTAGEGFVTFSGLNTTGQFTSSLNLGLSAEGTLHVLDHAQLTSGSTVMGYFSGSNGTATVSGDSIWTISGTLTVGRDGVGTLNIADGAQVLVQDDVIMNPNSNAWTSATININVTRDDMLVAGHDATGVINNAGRINLIADITTQAGVYRPLAQASGSFSGIINAIGGTWDNQAGTFTVQAITEHTSGIINSNSLANSRHGFNDNKMVVSFSQDILGTFDFNATEIVDLDLVENNTVLAAYEITTDVPGATLSFFVGEGRDVSNMEIWHRQSEFFLWEKLQAEDAVYANGYLTFSADDFSDYVVTEIIPEPASFSLLLAASTLVMLRRRTR